MFQIDYCEYNRTNVDYDRIYRPGTTGFHHSTAGAQEHKEN